MAGRSAGGKTPLVLLHGGPGSTHNYFEVLDALAEAAGLDKYRALRTFTAAFGLTPMRYLASLRVERARELLARGASCADAAFQAGFSDQAHLTRAFKERLGVTPGFYQRAVTGKSSPVASRQKTHL